MTEQKHKQKKQERSKSKRIAITLILELMILLALFGTYRLYITMKAENKFSEKQLENQHSTDGIKENSIEDSDEGPVQDAEEELTAEELAALKQQEKLKQEIKDREELIVKADRLALGYEYKEAIALLQGYQGSEGDYSVYPVLTSSINRIEKEKSELLLYGGSYDSITQINHIFFHSLVADPKKAFDGDSRAKGYNMYMATVSEFKKIIDKLYQDGYVLVNISDLTTKVTKDNTSKYEPAELYLRAGKKPLVLSIDDLSYYEYMNGDGFAKRIVIDQDGKSTCEMVMDDGTVTTGAYDIVPILDEFVEAHPDFSYHNAKGTIALTGYEGVLGYRTNDEASPTYEEDKKAAKKVAKALKENGWEFASHSWGHKNMTKASLDLLKRDTEKWLKQVAPLIGPTDIYIFPFGADIENTIGPYTTDKYHYLKEQGFNLFLGVYSKPWMQIKKDYVRMARRPIDGQAMLQFPERLKDLFEVSDVIDPDRPGRDW